jgi:hypothetical protein
MTVNLLPLVLSAALVPAFGADDWEMSYMPDFGEQRYFLNVPNKFISVDGRTLWLCYSVDSSTGWNGI